MSRFLAVTSQVITNEGRLYMHLDMDLDIDTDTEIDIDNRYYIYEYRYAHIYIYIYAWGPRFPRIMLFISVSKVKNQCFATAKCLFSQCVEVMCL